MQSLFTEELVFCWTDWETYFALQKWQLL